jgi:hypothetical protein
MRLWDRSENARELAQQGIEVWAPIPDCSDRYFVSNLGRAKSNVRGRGVQDLKATLMPSGYRSLGITRAEGGSAETHLLHRLVILTFDGPPTQPDHTDVRHGAGGTDDNRLCNLQWGTRSENMRDVIQHRRARVEARERPTRTEVWYQGKTLDKALLDQGLRFYNEKKLTMPDLADLWSCSVDVAANIVRGETRQELGLVRPERATANGREGEHHHAAVCSDDQLRAAFQLYVDHHWSSVQFAAHLGIPQITADSILRGRTRKYLDRPPGFQYPWPDAATMNRRVGDDHGGAKVTSEQILAVFEQIVDGTLTDMQAVQRALGVARGAAYAIAAGRSWGHLPRPSGLDAAIARIQRGILPPETRAAILADLRAGADRNEVKRQYQLSASQIAAYVTKANKQRAAGDAP